MTNVCCVHVPRKQRNFSPSLSPRRLYLLALIDRLASSPSENPKTPMTCWTSGPQTSPLSCPWWARPLTSSTRRRWSTPLLNRTLTGVGMLSLLNFYVFYLHLITVTLYKLSHAIFVSMASTPRAPVSWLRVLGSNDCNRGIHALVQQNPRTDCRRRLGFISGFIVMCCKWQINFKMDRRKSYSCVHNQTCGLAWDELLTSAIMWSFCTRSSMYLVSVSILAWDGYINACVGFSVWLGK